MLAAVAVAAIVAPAHASSETGGTVVDLNVDKNGTVTVKISATPTGKPSCATNSYWSYQFANSSSGGSMLSMLLNAYNRNQAVYFYGLGTCSIDPTTEDLGYVRL